MSSCQAAESGPKLARDLSGTATRDSTLTLAAIGIVAYVCCDLFHELAGHGGACLVTGGKAVGFSTAHFQCFGGRQHLVAASGILLNLVLGILLSLALRFIRNLSAHARYFLWLSMAYNLFSGLGNAIQSSILRSGDWANALKGLPLSWHFRAATIVLGIPCYIFAVWIVSKEMRTFLGDSLARTWKLILVPYFAAAVVACAAGLLNSIVPKGQALMSAVSTTLGIWGFIFVPAVLPLVHNTNQNARITRSTAWIVAAGLVGGVFVLAIGPGIRFR